MGTGDQATYLNGRSSLRKSTSRMGAIISEKRDEQFARRYSRVRGKKKKKEDVSVVHVTVVVSLKCSRRCCSAALFILFPCFEA